MPFALLWKLLWMGHSLRLHAIPFAQPTVALSACDSGTLQAVARTRRFYWLLRATPRYIRSGWRSGVRVLLQEKFTLVVECVGRCFKFQCLIQFRQCLLRLLIDTATVIVFISCIIKFRFLVGIPSPCICTCGWNSTQGQFSNSFSISEGPSKTQTNAID